MKKLIVKVLCVSLLVGLFTGCSANTGGDSKDEGSVYKIAVVAPMTGDNAEYGKCFAAAAEIMVEQWNAKGGVNGKKIQVAAYDDKNSGEDAVSIAQKIVSDKDVVGVIGHFSSGVSMAAAPTYEENKLVEISPSASHPDYSSCGDYIFRNNTVISSEATVIVDVLENDLKVKKVGIISIKTDWGTSAGTITKELIEKNDSLELVAHEEVMESSDDYSPAIAKLKEAGAEAVICVGMYNLLAPVSKQYKAVDPEIKVVGFSNAYTEQVIELGGEAVEGLMAPVSFYSESEDPLVKEFVAKYKEKMGNEPSSLTAQAYDSVGILLTALQEAGSFDKELLREKVAQIKYKGTTGETYFDKIGDATKVFTKVIVKDGKFVKYE